MNDPDEWGVTSRLTALEAALRRSEEGRVGSTVEEVLADASAIETWLTR